MRGFIESKRDGHALSSRDWQSIIEAFADGSMDEAQMAALCMACVWRGMDMTEIMACTEAMIDSGSRIAFGLDRPVIDKHSSGGVADLVSLVTVPMVAACDVPVAKLSGRALGHTGGTIDKLESIPGFRTSLSVAEFTRQVREVGCAIAAQTADLVPADKRLYSLRDRTATIPAPGLIAASIVSKKIAGGADAIVFDVKVGRGAFMTNLEGASGLARTLVEVTKHFGKRASAILSNMDEPLGTFIGTGLEVREARRFLTGEERDARSFELCVLVATQMMATVGERNAREKVLEALDTGAAYQKFVEMIKAQGGTLEGLIALEPRNPPLGVLAPSSGYVGSINAVALGHAARSLTVLDDLSGLRVNKRIGDRVEAQEALAEIYGGTPRLIHEVQAAFKIQNVPADVSPLIYEALDGW